MSVQGFKLYYRIHKWRSVNMQTKHLSICSVPLQAPFIGADNNNNINNKKQLYNSRSGRRPVYMFNKSINHTHMCTIRLWHAVLEHNISLTCTNTGRKAFCSHGPPPTRTKPSACVLFRINGGAAGMRTIKRSGKNESQ